MRSNLREKSEASDKIVVLTIKRNHRILRDGAS